MSVEAKPIFFITLKWNETWERSGSPTVSRISYRKTDGDDRLKHFCGWMDVVAVDAANTRVTLYEEVEAMGRSPEDVLEGHVGTIRRILR